MVDARGNSTVYGHDALGHMTTITDADGLTTTYTYNVLGQRISQSRRGTGSQPTLVSWTYDAAGRMATRGAGGATTSYTYDDAGNRTQASTTGSTISTTYDRLNRPLSVAVTGDGPATTTYTYSLTSPTWTDPSGSYTATLDKFDRQVALTDPIHGASRFTWSYRAGGQPTTVAAPNANTTTYGYDDAGTLVTKNTASGATNRALYAWARNRAGQILTEASTITNDPANGTTSYTYDPLSRLVASSGPGLSTAYGWQAVPNRDLATLNGNSTGYTFDAANRETTTSSGNIDYDAEGRLTARPGQILVWDDLGRLTQVKNSSTLAVIAAYTYDALDRLLTVTPQTGSAYRLRYVGLTMQVAQVVDNTTSASLYKLANGWDGERLFEWTTTSQTFYGTNGHHDTTWTAGSTGAVSATLRHDPWGNLTTSWGSYLPAFRFQGSWFDPTVELSWVVARWYAPGLGRFISEDLLLGQPADPPSRHLYAYGRGEPLAKWDPLGTCPAVEDGGCGQRYWIRTMANDSPIRIAQQLWGDSSKYPYIYNRNRDVFRLPTSRNAGSCIYVPVSVSPRVSVGCPAGKQTGTKDAVRRQQAAATLNVDWWGLTEKDLISLTQDVSHFKNGQTGRYAKNMVPPTLAALDLAWVDGSAVLPPNYYYFLFQGSGNATILGHTLPFIRPGATTIGAVIFVSSPDIVNDKDLMSHEYIHLMQYAANSNQWADYLSHCHDIGDGCGGPGQSDEAIAYLWQVWLENYFDKGGPTKVRPEQLWTTPTLDEIAQAGPTFWWPF